MATYYPLIGNNLITSFVDNGAAAVTRTAGATLAGTGWPGKRRASVVVTATPATVANDRILRMNLLLPDGLKELSPGVQDLNKMRPTVHATSGTLIGSAVTSSDYGFFYSVTTTGTIAPDVAFPLFVNGAFTSGFTHVAGSTDVVIVTPGVYAVEYGVEVLEASQIALFLDGVVVPGSIYGSGAGTQQNNGSFILTTVSANQVLTLRNHTSAAAITPQVPSGGTAENNVSFIRIRSLAGGSSATPDSQMVPALGEIETAVVNGSTEYIIPVFLTTSANAPTGPHLYYVDIDWGWSSAN